LSLGRICPEKGFHHGLDAARRAGVKFRLAGQVFPYEAHEHYFATEIVPRLGPDAEFIGPVATEAKQRLLANARCLLVPSLVPETSSLVAMEAIAAGTPVIAFANGALAEIIDHGVTGFIVRSGEEMADAIAAVGDLDPEVCRTTAIVRFSREAMTAKYLTLYDTLVARTRTRAGPRPRLPISIASRRAHAVTELRDEAELRDIVPEWRALCASSDGTPFQRPEWLLPWWRRFGAGELRVLVVRYGSELVGLAPLYLRRGWQGDRELAFVGAGNTDYLDVITAPAHRDEVAAAVVDRIAGGHADWDGCALGPLPQRSPLLTALAPRGWTAPRTRTDVCPVLSVWGAHRDIMSTVRERQLAQLHYERRRLSREHAVDVREGSAATAAAMLAELCRLHTGRWRDRGDGVLEDERTRAFHLDVVREMANAGILRLYTLTIDGRPAAAFYGFAEHRRWFYYLGGFDPAFRRYSVGSLVILHALEKAAGENATQFNFLRGAESYKYRWGAVDTSVYGLRLVRGTASATTRPREPIRAR
jgi:CelD/BcsL family acetyltransferase involved in cellulose biosynthesis